ncbi:RNA helicase, putative [Giardia lamblia P15]|uniref:RNA helicase, putative n=1 Tax=Giardia intestinalis (strain P15) TaxID=658858 RepID=E1EVT8_GIAIA|nr:RNA helicase, putative [Giardia lamblia P15]
MSHVSLNLVLFNRLMRPCVQFIRDHELFGEVHTSPSLYNLDLQVIRDPGSVLLKRSIHSRSIVDQHALALGEKVQQYHSKNMQLLADLFKNKALPSSSVQTVKSLSSDPQLSKDWAYFAPLQKALASHQVILVKGATGSGKSTCIPAALLATEPQGKIIVSEPRRVAAISLAGYQQQALPGNLRQAVAYAVRFQSTVTLETKLIYQTDGVTLQYLLDDPCLLNVSYLILDEIHERSSNQILLLAIVLRVIRYNPKVRVILMSATLDEVQLLQYVRRYTASTSISLDNPHYSTDVSFQPCREDYILQIVDEIVTLHTTTTCLDDGILVFLSGADDIAVCLALLWERLSVLGTGRQGERPWVVIPFHSKIPAQQALYPFMPITGRRRIILATNVAETSVTIPGIRYVIDSGLQKRMMYLPEHSTSVLVVVPITISSHMQRKGRVGRTQQGTCIFLYPKYVVENEMLVNPHSTLQFEPIDHIYLMLQSFSQRFKESFPSFSLCLEVTDLIDLVDSTKLSLTKQTLYYSYLLTTTSPSSITRQPTLCISVAGLVATSLPVSPRTALFLMVAYYYGVQREACLIAAGLEVGWDDFLGTNNVPSLCQGSDHLSLLYALVSPLSKTGLASQSYHQANQVAHQLEDVLDRTFKLHKDTLFEFLRSYIQLPDLIANPSLATETGDIIRLCLALTSHMTVAQRTSTGFCTLFSGAIVNPSSKSSCAGTTSSFLVYNHSVVIANKVIAICCTELNEHMLKLNRWLAVGTPFEVISQIPKVTPQTTKLGFRRNVKR